ncbi:MAG: PD-(D/E)XK nuclease family protein [Bacteroidota bacterium]
MKPCLSFIDQIVTQLHKKHTKELAETALLVPNYTFGNKLLRSLGCQIGEASWAPMIYTLPAFIDACSPLHRPERIALLLQLHKVVRVQRVRKASFEDFSTWGGQLLDDFEMIDDYLISAEELFTIPKKKLSGDPMTYDSFWGIMHGNNVGEIQQRWLSLWRRLPALYERYRTTLLGNEMAYGGLQRRKLYEMLKYARYDFKNITYKRIIGVGLYELTPSEEQILRYIGVQIPLSFYWDRDPYYCDPTVDHPAGEAFRRREKAPFFSHAMEKTYTSHIQAEPPDVEVIAAHGVSGQVTALSEILQKLIKEEGAEEVAGKSVIIMPESTFLLPLLANLPACLGEVEIQGYPLNLTPAYTLLLTLLRFQIAWREAKGTVREPLLHAIIALSSHPYLRKDEKTTQKLQEIASSDLSQLANLLPTLGLLGNCLKPLEENDNVLTFIEGQLFDIKGEKIATKNDMPAWEKVAFDELLELWKMIRRTCSKEKRLVDPSRALISFVAQEVANRSLTIPAANNRKGLPIMLLNGTIGLDFDYVFVLSMNEGVFPPPLKKNSFVPDVLQKKYNFPDTARKQGVFAYPFYRLLARAKKAFLLYNKSDGRFGERSRYLHDLTYGLGWKMTTRDWMPSLLLPKRMEMVIKKDKAIIEQLTYCDVNEKILRVWTPSAINTYLNCPLCFYTQHVLGLRKPEVPHIEMDPLTFGRLFHAIMEKIYQPHVGKIIQRDTTSQIKKALQQEVEAVYTRLLPYVGTKRSIDWTAKKVLETFVKKVVSQDASYTPFKLLSVEAHHAGKSSPYFFPLSNKQKIAFGGVIDRIDKKNEVIRVIDYKTGAFTPKVDSLDNLFDTMNPTRNQAAFQLFYYAWLYTKQHDLPYGMSIMPAVMTTRNVSTSHEAGAFLLRNDSGYAPIYNMAPYFFSFEQKLQKVMDDIFNPSIPFIRSVHQHTQKAICEEVFF